MLKLHEHSPSAAIQKGASIGAADVVELYPGQDLLLRDVLPGVLELGKPSRQAFALEALLIGSLVLFGGACVDRLGYGR